MYRKKEKKSFTNNQMPLFRYRNFSNKSLIKMKQDRVAPSITDPPLIFTELASLGQFGPVVAMSVLIFVRPLIGPQMTWSVLGLSLVT